MYDLALSVSACLRAGTRVDVGWVVEVRGFSSRNGAEALVVTPGGGCIGSVLSGALDDQLEALLTEKGPGRLVDLQVNDLDAARAGYSCGGGVRCILTPAADLPAELWPALLRREPVCLVTDVVDDRTGATRMFTAATVGEAGADVAHLFSRGKSDAEVLGDSLVTSFWPTTRLVTVGAGAVPEALEAAARLLGWAPQNATDTMTAVALIAGLSSVDGVVVTSHDRDVDGPALAEALDSHVGYIGALGSRRTQQGRAEWLAKRGITDLSRIHGPAGLRIGANTPAEIAVAIVAEMLATKSGATPESLRDSADPIHLPPPVNASPAATAQSPWPRAR